jgi:hypothetical protein
MSKSEKPEFEHDTTDRVEPTEELSDEQLKDVAGGFEDIKFVHKIDKSTPIIDSPPPPPPPPPK